MKYNFGDIPYIEPNTLAQIRFYPKTNKTVVIFMDKKYVFNHKEFAEIFLFVIQNANEMTDLGSAIQNMIIELVVTRWMYEKPRK